ncbi:hypothetical protein GLYMA_04G216600v4 [Glycine max]|uniref:Uncharacterized protein n=1 Tax=Glycine max TaxID=3847 RepID=A0A0R0KB18_SOYBN|nr:hypothetical protein JHK86_010973 [Glycine max]KAH1112539.1 hypothetical protein GYH30_010689 [Glycine max]KRH64106.1 hypothetical protein GLYMA_04G216600v4 [Glycine max]
MPEVKVESNYIYTSVPDVSASEGETFNLETQVPNACHAHATSYSDSELSDSSAKDGNTESPWEEFSPVSVNNSNQSNLESELSQKAMELLASKCPDYEPIVSDYDSSESEGDSFCLNQPKEQEKPKCNEQDSYFWQAQELLHSSKERENSVKKSDNIDISDNSLVDIFNSSTESTRVTLSKEKPGFQKNYSFVAEPVLTSKDKLVDVIVDSFKKADESKTEH